jgi:hypothetical protein
VSHGIAGEEGERREGEREGRREGGKEGGKKEKKVSGDPPGGFVQQRSLSPVSCFHLQRTCSPRPERA